MSLTCRVQVPSEVLVKPYLLTDACIRTNTEKAQLTVRLVTKIDHFVGETNEANPDI